MGILQEQLTMSKSIVNGRTIIGQQSAGWVMKNLAISQLRASETNSDLVSGFWGGGENLGAGRPASMYPDNRTIFAAGDVVIGSDGIESIRDSKTAAQIEII